MLKFHSFFALPLTGESFTSAHQQKDSIFAGNLPKPLCHIECSFSIMITVNVQAKNPASTM